MDVKKIFLAEAIISFAFGILLMVLGILLLILPIDSPNNTFGSAVSCLCVSVILVFLPIYSLFCKKNGRTFQNLDERQIQVHLLGCLISLFLFVAYIFTIGLLDTFFSISFSSFLIESMYGLVGVSFILVLYLIWNDSFVNFENKKEILSFVGIYLAIGIANLSLGISNSASLVNDGQLTSNTMYFATAIFNITIAVNLLIKNFVVINKNEEQ